VLFNFAFDTFTGWMKNNPELEVQRTTQLRDKIISLGPFFIKLGQALSIRLEWKFELDTTTGSLLGNEERIMPQLIDRSPFPRYKEMTN
jgi:hypothetical protein